MKRAVLTILFFISLLSFLNACEHGKGHESDENNLEDMDISYTITFNANNGAFSDSTIEKTIQFPPGKITLPDNPTQANYIFTGWNTSADGSGETVTPDTPLTADIAVYAQWTWQHTIIFHANGGTFPDGTIQITADQSAFPDNPTQNGYVFSGWNTASDGSGEVFTPDTPATVTITVYAQWKEQYHVTFHAGGGTFPDSAAEKTLPFISGEITLPDRPKQADYTFTGWNTAADGSGKAFTADTPLTANTTVYAQWKWRYTVTFHASGGTFSDSTTEKTVPLRSGGIAFPDNPTQADYLFAGWNTSADGSGETFTDQTSVTADATVYAQWEKQYTVIFHANGGLFPDNTIEKTDLFISGGITLPDRPKQADYTFTGWNTSADGSGEAFTPDTPLTADITAYAQWKWRYTVVFHTNGGTFSDSATEKTVPLRGGGVAFPDNPTQTNYAFTGWNTAANGSGEIFTDQTSVTADITVYAQWTLQYSVIFHTNGGLFPDNTTEKTLLLVSGGITLPDNPAHGTHLFAGWNTSASGSGDTFTKESALTANITVYAQWKEQYTVTFYDTEGILADHLTMTVLPDTEITLPGISDEKSVTEWALDRNPVPETHTGQYLIAQNTAFYAVKYALIKTPADLDDVRNHLNDNTVKYKLANNINLSGYPNWAPIGDGSRRFTGLIDGGGYKITGLTINAPTSKYIGLFSIVGYPSGAKPNGHIRNLGVETSAAGIKGDSYIGVIAGQLYGALTKSYATGKIAGSSVIGGMFGNTSDANVSSCFTSVYITGKSGIMGGIAGNIQKGKIENCSAIGNIEDVGTSSNVGGIIGTVIDGKPVINNCSYAGNIIKAKRGVGGIAGFIKNGTITNSFVMSSLIQGTFNVGRVTGVVQSGYMLANNFAYSAVKTGSNVSFVDRLTHKGTSKTHRELTTKTTYTNAVKGNGLGGAGWQFPPWEMNEFISYPFNTDVLKQVYITVVNNVTTIRPITGGRFTVPSYPAGKTSWNTRQDGAGTTYRAGASLSVKAGIILYAR